MLTKQVSWLGCCTFCLFAFFLASIEAANPASPSPIKNLTVLSPNGGESFALDDSLTIRWDMSDSVNAMMGQLVFNISMDSGKTFLYLGDIRKSSPYWQAKAIKFSLRDSIWDEHNIKWKAIVPSTGCLIRINEYNITTISDESDSMFRITSGAHANHFIPAINKAGRGVHEIAVYTIQGRKMVTSGVRWQKIPAKESKNVNSENGQIRLIAY